MKRKCNKCGKSNPLSKFRIRSDNKKHDTICKYCENKYHDKNVKIRRNEKMLFILSYLKSHPCIDCGEKDPIVLDFDHIKGKKKFNIGEMVHRDRSIKNILKEISKCVVRCANCHRRKTAKQFNYRKWKIIQERECGVMVA